MRRFGAALLLGVSLAGCSAARPVSLAQEDEACFRTRTFTEEIPRYLWGDPIHDPCWRFRRLFDDR
jgi:hypothetical protein